MTEPCNSADDRAAALRELSQLLGELAAAELEREQRALRAANEVRPEERNADA